jgi:hypothetical protein
VESIDTIADIRLIGRAMNEDWPVYKEQKEAIVKKLMTIVESNDPQMQIAASRALMAADALNQKRQALQEKKLEQEQKRKIELIDLAHKLGIVGHDSGSIGVVDSQPSRITNE